MKIFKKIICLMIVVVLCFCSVFPVSASTITLDELKSTYDITYSENDFPYFVIMTDNNKNEHLLLLSNTEFLYVDTDIEEMYVKNYVVEYVCENNGSYTVHSYSQEEYSKILTDFTIVNSNFDILDTNGNVYFKKIEEPEETDPPQTDEPTETPTEQTKNIIVSNGLVHDILLCIGLDVSELNPNTPLYMSCVVIAVVLVLSIVFMILKTCTSFFRGGRL